MPIDIDRFEDATDGPVPTSQRVVRFLATNDDQAFRRAEIADAIDADPETVGTNLTRLKERSLVRHREPYWAFTDDRERAVETVRTLYGEAFVEETLGESSGSQSPVSRRDHREAATDFHDRVESELDGVEELYLFGSVAAGEATGDSDVDVLAVVSGEADYAAVDDRLLDLAYDVQLEHDVRIEVHSMPADEFAGRDEQGDPLVSAVLEEGQRLLGGESNRD